MLRNNPLEQQIQSEKFLGIYRGYIEDNNDPEKMGRCKIRVHGIHTDEIIKNAFEGIPTDELPWSEPAFGLFEGSVSGFGGWSIPLQGSHVFLFFENGHILQPRYFATVPGLPTESPNTKRGFNDPDGNYPTSDEDYPTKLGDLGENYHSHGLDEPDLHKLAREITDNTCVEYRNNKRDGVKTGTTDNIKSAKFNSQFSEKKEDRTEWNEPESWYDAEYPHNKVFNTHSGMTFEIDDTPNKERIMIFHPSGSFLEIKSDLDKDNHGNSNSKLTGGNHWRIIEGTINKHIYKDKIENIDGERKTRIGRENEGDDALEVHGNRFKYVYKNDISRIKNNEKKVVEGNKYQNIDINEEKYIEKDYLIEVSQNREIKIGVDEIKLIDGDESITISSNEIKSIVGNKSEEIGGDVNKISSNEYKSTIGDKNETIGGNYLISTTGNCSISVVGNCSITSTSMVSVDAPMINLNSGTSVPIPAKPAITETPKANKELNSELKETNEIDDYNSDENIKSW